MGLRRPSCKAAKCFNIPISEPGHLLDAAATTFPAAIRRPVPDLADVESASAVGHSGAAMGRDR